MGMQSGVNNEKKMPMLAASLAMGVSTLLGNWRNLGCSNKPASGA
jgi:hypothetical protein